jgi:hypothetical protein
MLNNFFNLITIFSDAPQPFQIGFQDSAAPGFTGIVELHNTIFFYLVFISVAVFWVLASIIYYFNSTKSAIVHKYLNHGKGVPIQKCYYKNNNNKFSVYRYNMRIYSFNNISHIKTYENAYDMRKELYKENKDKSGIYMFTNKLTNDIYIGQSINLANRFKNYFNISYLKHKESLVFSSALIKYSYSNFSITILEICDISELVTREQYYFDILKPEYNTLKIAGSSLNQKHTEETKYKFSSSLTYCLTLPLG